MQRFTTTTSFVFWIILKCLLICRSNQKEPKAPPSTTQCFLFFLFPSRNQNQAFQHFLCRVVTAYKSVIQINSEIPEEKNNHVLVLNVYEAIRYHLCIPTCPLIEGNYWTKVNLPIKMSICRAAFFKIKVVNRTSGFAFLCHWTEAKELVPFQGRVTTWEKRVRSVKSV